MPSRGKQIDGPSSAVRSMADMAAADLFNPVTDRRISELIVDQVRQLIRARQLNPGDRLPAERNLCERFGVSRVTVREALRVLEANGLVEIRVGARGGAFVTTPSRERVGAGIADLLTLSAVTAAEVTEARLILELGMISMVCERADDDDIAALFDLCDRQEAALAGGDQNLSLDLSAQFHARLAECAHNTAVQMLIQSVRGPLLTTLDRGSLATSETDRSGVKEHRKLVHAIQRREADRATEIMRRHLTRTTGPAGNR